ncbi:MAG: type II toxin-antitoxin system VapC family toxin [Clostridiales Family XIII bacterium]|jgi:hypothetical protein|nr:type II toxin-antitoxin system VapC family toxin [Clostridiales Family XIII bacterium]
MDILIDTNIVISAALFPSPRINRFLSLISEEHSLFLCSYSILEVERVVSRKFPAKALDVELFLSKLRYTLVHTPSVDILGEISMRDKNDYPIKYGKVNTNFMNLNIKFMNLNIVSSCAYSIAVPDIIEGGADAATKVQTGDLP